MSKRVQKRVGKVSVECPHCGFQQPESVFARTTICRKCNEHYELARAGDRDPASSPRAASLLKKFRTLIGVNKSRTIRCFDCNQQQHISTSARSSICPGCGSYIDLRDIKISTSFNRSIQTQGCLVVTPKGDLSSTKITCGSAIIHGRLRGNLICSGTVRLRMQGKLYGGIDATHLVVEKGSDVEFVRQIRAASVEINGKIAARIACEGTLKISRKGALDGTVYAKSIAVDKGGQFRGELIIGKQELSQPDLITDSEVAAAMQRTLAFGS